MKLIDKKCYIEDWVDKGCQWFTFVYSIPLPNTLQITIILAIH